MTGLDTGFGMPNVYPFVTPQPVTVQEQPEQDESGGKGAGGILSGIAAPVLGLAGMIPGPQQPFLLGASALAGTTGNLMQGNVKGAASNLSQLTSNAALGSIFGSNGSITPQSAESLKQDAVDWISGGQGNPFEPALPTNLSGSTSIAPKPNVTSSPSFGGYNFQYQNPYDTYGMSRLGMFGG